MFCRSCGKKLSDKAVACIGCGMNPREGNTNCPACGVATKDKQVICTACGGSLQGGSADAWTRGQIVGLLILSYCIPLFGWIYGGIHAHKATKGSLKEKQAFNLVGVGIVGAVTSFFFFYC